MGTTLKPIMFVDTELTIIPHTASFADHIGKPIKAGDFASGSSIRVSKIEHSGEYVFEVGGYFVEGPEA